MKGMKSEMQKMKKFLSMLLAIVMIVGMMPLNVFATDPADDGTKTITLTLVDSDWTTPAVLLDNPNPVKMTKAADSENTWTAEVPAQTESVQFGNLIGNVPSVLTKAYDVSEDTYFTIEFVTVYHKCDIFDSTESNAVTFGTEEELGDAGLAVLTKNDEGVWSAKIPNNSEYVSFYCCEETVYELDQVTKYPTQEPETKTITLTLVDSDWSNPAVLPESGNAPILMTKVAGRENTWTASIDADIANVCFINIVNDDPTAMSRLYNVSEDTDFTIEFVTVYHKCDICDESKLGGIVVFTDSEDPGDLNRGMVQMSKDDNGVWSARIAADTKFVGFGGCTVAGSGAYFTLKDVTTYPESKRYVAQIGEEKYETLKEAVEVGGNIVLLDDVTLGEKLTVSKDVTISGAHTITRADNYTGTLFTVSSGAALTLDGGLTIDGGNKWEMDMESYQADLKSFQTIARADSAKWFTLEEGAPVATAFMITTTGGTVNLNAVTIQNNYSANSGVVSAGANSTITLTGATIKHIASTQGNGIVANASGANIRVVVNDGTVIDGNHVGGNHGVFKIYSGAVLTMNGGEIKNTTGWNSNGVVVGLYWGTFNMNGGTICSNSAANGPDNGRCAAIYLHSGHQFNMTGGTICHNRGGSRGGVDASYSNGTVSITGGNILDNTSYYAEQGYAASYPPDVNLPTNGTATITGGTYTQDVSKWLAPDLGLAYNPENNHYTVTDELAKIGQTKYGSVAAAVAAAQEGDTIVVCASHKPSQTIVIDKNVTLDLNGRNIYGYGTVNPIIRVLADVTVTGNGMIDTANQGDGYCFIVGNTETTGALTIENGTFKGTTSAISVTNGKLTILDGDFRVKPYEDSYEYLINCIDANYKDGSAVVEIKGGVFTKFNPADNAAEGAGTNFVAEGYVAVDNGDGTWTVREDTTKVTVTVNDATMVAGNALPEFTYTSDVAVEGMNVHFAVNTDGKTAGEYDITATVDEMDGYEFTVVPGKLTVQKALVRVFAANNANVKYFTDLNEALQYAAGLNAYIPVYVLDNLTVDETIVFKDTNGGNVELQSVKVGGGTYSITAKGDAFVKMEAGLLNVKNLRINAQNDAFYVTGGTLNLNGHSANSQFLEITAQTGNCVYIRGGNANVQGAKLTSLGVYPAIQGNGNYTGNVTIQKWSIGTLLSEISAPNSDMAIYWPGNGALKIVEGTITGATAVYAKSGTVTIEGGELIATGEKADFVHSSNGANGTGDALAIEACKDTAYETPVVTITGGTFTSANANAVGYYVCGEKLANENFITGGTYSDNQVAALCAAGYHTKDNGNDTWTVEEKTTTEVTVTVNDATMVAGNALPEFTYTSNVAVEGMNVHFAVNTDGKTAGEYDITATVDEMDGYEFTVVPGKLTVQEAVAKVGSVYYADLQEAVDTGKTVDLLKNVVLTETLVINEKGTYLKLSGYTLSGELDTLIRVNANGTVSFSAGGKAAFKNTGDVFAVEKGNVSIYGDGAIISEKASCVSVSGGRTVIQKAKLTANGECPAIQCNSNGAGDVTIQGGTITGATAVYAQSGTVKISDGKFSGAMKADAAAKMQLSGGLYTVRPEDAWCVAPKGPMPNNDGSIYTWTVAEGVIAVDGNMYPSWDEAESSIKADSKIVLYADVTNNPNGEKVGYTFPGNGNITMDLNGHTFKSTWAVSVSNKTKLWVVDSVGGGKVHFTNDNQALYTYTSGEFHLAEGIQYIGAVQSTRGIGYFYVGDTQLFGLEGLYRTTKESTMRLSMSEEGNWNLIYGKLTLTADDDRLANNTLTIRKDTSVDLNGNDLTAKNIVVFGNLIDSQDGVGSVTASGEYYYTNHSNGDYLPLYDSTNGCYRLYATSVKVRGAKLSGDDTLKVGYTVYFNHAEAYKLLSEMAASNECTLTVSWKDGEGVFEYDFTNELVKQFADAAYAQMLSGAEMKKSMNLNVTGMSTLNTGDVVKNVPTVSSTNGVVISGEAYEFTK